MPAYVISPWARRGAVVHTRYDQYSFLRTAELIAGGEPPDVEGTRYRAIQPQQDLNAVNSASAADARLSRSLPWNRIDLVPQSLSDCASVRAARRGDGQR